MQANLIDASLASGRRSEYIFYYKPRSSAGAIQRYWVWARLAVYNHNAIASCITNETDTIHCINEDRYATLADPVR